MAKRPHWTTEEVLEEILTDEEPREEWVDNTSEGPVVEDGRGELDREEPVMEGSDEKFSDSEDLEEAEGTAMVTLGNRIANQYYKQQ